MPFRPLPCRTVRKVLEHFDFTQQPMAGTSHEKWVCTRDGHRYVVTLDCHGGEVRALDVDSIIGQMGIAKKRFWQVVQIV